MKKTFGLILTCLTVLALIFGAPGTTATYAAAAVDPLTAQKTSPEGLLNPDGTLNVDASFHGTLDLAGWNVQMDPQRGPVFAPDAAVAPGNWAGLGTGGDGAIKFWVYAVAVSGANVYVGGHFTNTSNNGTLLPAADYIAKWDGSAWSALGSNGAGNGALNGVVGAIAVSGTDVYVGGHFTDTSNNGTILPAADYIAKWNGSAWSALGSNGAGDGSINYYVATIAVSGTSLYVGGGFTDVNNNGTLLPAADYVAKWNGSAWSALGSNGAGNGSLSGGVSAIAVSGANVYVGGNFQNVNNKGTILTAADYIAKWNGSAWSALGSNGAGNGSLDSFVRAIAVSGANVYVGGNFTNINNKGTILTAADYLAKWDGSAWSAVGSNGAGDSSLNNPPNALVFSGTNLYLGGYFNIVNNSNGTGLTTADYIVKWDGSIWSALGTRGPQGSLTFRVNAVAVSGTDVYVGGHFLDVNNNGTSLTAADYIAKWDGSAWSALGANGAVRGSLNGDVYAIAVSGSNVYVGGAFTNVNNNGTIIPAADYIAKWDGSAWSALGSNGAGNGSVNDYVKALAVSGTGLYVGGEFTNVNNSGTILPAADYIAKWNGSAWSALGANSLGDGSLNGDVYTLAVSGTNLYVGGCFIDTNSIGAADFIARWNGSAWSALGSNGAGNGSIAGQVYAIAVSGTNVYAGGVFQNVNNNGTILPAADFIAKWNGSAWSALGSNGAGNGSFVGQVSAIAVNGTSVFVGGEFTNVNNNGTILPAADYIAKWNGGAWSALSSNGAGDGSVTNTVYVKTVDTIVVSGKNLYVGGSFRDINSNGMLLPAADYVAVYGLGAAPTPTPTVTSTRTKTRTATPTVTSTVTPTISATPTVTGTVTPTQTIGASPTQTMDVSPTATTTPSPAVTMTETSTETTTVTPTETPTETMTITPALTITPTATAT